MAEVEWDEVGQRFAELGRQLRHHWEREPQGTGGARDEVRSALDDVSAALDRLGGAITDSVNDPEVRASASEATAGLLDAVSTSLGRLADRVERTGDDEG